jgi:hypothetical protein
MEDQPAAVMSRAALRYCFSSPARSITSPQRLIDFSMNGIISAF